MYLWSHGTAYGLDETVIGRLERPGQPSGPPEDTIVFGSAQDLCTQRREWDGVAALLCVGPEKPRALGGVPIVWAPRHLEYLKPRDVVALHSTGTVNVLYRRESAHNTILLTERCNSYCLMCSQPPRYEDDSFRVGQTLRLLELVDPDTVALGISGGEPTLLGDGLLAVISKARDVLPRTGLHVLTNGRKFTDPGVAQAMANLRHPDLMLGIPLYSDVDTLHDYVVQAYGAYKETLNGLYNLAVEGVRIEIRVVLHRQTYQRLPQLAAFIARNLPFVEHVALMGLEMYGFTLSNLGVLWIDPQEYRAELEEATLFLAANGLDVSVYNHQLCTIPRSVWPFAKKSISDWKNVYLEECAPCGVRAFCGGFFQSATKKHSAHIRSLPPLSPEATAALRSIHGIRECGVCQG
jgi:His-Xaa-Ser system radical SAM maturase HxsC